MDRRLPVSSVHGIFQARILDFPLQEIFPTQGLNPGLPHCRQILYYLSHQGSPDFWATQEVSSFEYMSKSKIAGSCGKSMFTSIRNCQSVCTILHSYHRWMWVPVASHPHHCLMWLVVCFFFFFDNHSKRCAVVSHCLNMQFPNKYDVELFSYAYLPSVLSSLVKLFRYFTYFYLYVFI